MTLLTAYRVSPIELVSPGGTKAWDFVLSTWGQVSWYHGNWWIVMVFPCSVYYSKANSTLGFLRRNLWRCPAKLKESAYISLVLSTLEYAASVWDPHLAKDINKLENIQRRSARFVKGDYCTASSVTQMLLELGWQDLESRRRDLRLALLYKVVLVSSLKMLV